MTETSQPGDAHTAPGSTAADSSPDNGVERRSLVKSVVAGILSVVLGAVPFIAGTLFFLDPLLRKKTPSDDDVTGGGVEKDEQGFIKLAVNVDTLEAGKPQDVTVLDDKVDAWNKFLSVPVGKVWLRKNDAGQVLAFNVICPHLGCSVSYRQNNNDLLLPLPPQCVRSGRQQTKRNSTAKHGFSGNQTQNQRRRRPQRKRNLDPLSKLPQRRSGTDSGLKRTSVPGTPVRFGSSGSRQDFGSYTLPKVLGERQMSAYQISRNALASGSRQNRGLTPSG